MPTECAKLPKMRTNSPISRILIAAFAIVTVFGLVLTGQKGRASSAVDVAIVVALDVSASVDGGEYQLMREGMARAIMSDPVANAIKGGTLGADALTLVQWSGFTEQVVKIDWIRVSTDNELANLADRVRTMTRRYDGGATDIGGAIEFSRGIIKSLPFKAARQVIDIVGDGPNNVNYSPANERDRTIKAGITINGLAVLGEVPILVEYFEQFIIGGEGAFAEKTSDFDGFESAMRRKLVREISSMLLF